MNNPLVLLDTDWIVASSFVADITERRAVPSLTVIVKSRPEYSSSSESSHSRVANTPWPDGTLI